MDTPNLRRYEVSWEAVLPPSNTSNSGVFHSILLCTFIVLNLCQTDSKAQHQNPINKIIISIAVAKSNTTETPGRVYVNSGKHF